MHVRICLLYAHTYVRSCVRTTDFQARALLYCFALRRPAPKPRRVCGGCLCPVGQNPFKFLQCRVYRAHHLPRNEKPALVPVLSGCHKESDVSDCIQHCMASQPSLYPCRRSCCAAAVDDTVSQIRAAQTDMQPRVARVPRRSKTDKLR